MERLPLECDEAVVGEDGALKLFLRSPNGAKSNVTLSAQAQHLLLQALLASSLLLETFDDPSTWRAARMN